MLLAGLFFVLGMSTTAQAFEGRVDSGPSKVGAGVTLIEYVVQDGGWRSPEALSDDFPNLNSKNCGRYGRNYGYRECEPKLNRRPRPGAAESTPAAEAPSDPKASLRRPRNVPQAVKPFKQSDKKLWVYISRQAAAARSGIRTDSTAARKLAGQVILTGFAGRNTRDADAARAAKSLREGMAAGIFFGVSNVDNPNQVRSLVKAFKKAAGTKPPLLLVAQPGGSPPVLLEEKGFNLYAAANMIGREDNPFSAQFVYREMASELAALGFNTNVGPSLSVCQDRSAPLSSSCFGASPRRVAAFVAAFNDAHHDRVMLTALQYAPAVKPAPAIAEQPGVEIIRRLTKRLPADAIVVRPAVLSGGLADGTAAFGQDRNGSLRLAGFDGVVIADLTVRAPETPVRYEGVIIQALTSGADMVMIASNPGFKPNDPVAAAITVIEKAVASGRLSAARLIEAAGRAESLRNRLNRPRENKDRPNDRVAAATQ